jgi:O-acetylhomoserine (thiol)-lyase
MKPFDLGADLVYHSATKFLSGHGTVIGGVVVDGGSFDWEKLGPLRRADRALRRLPQHGVQRGVTVGAFLLRARREGLRDFGASMSPHTAWLILQGIETLPLRMERHMRNTRRWWSSWPRTLRVARRASDAGVASQPRARAEAAAAGAGLGVQLRHQGQPRTGQEAFIEALKLFSHLANVGDCRSLVIHPASTTHFRMTDEALPRRGHHAGHHPPVDRAGRPGRPDRRPEARAEGRGEG